MAVYAVSDLHGQLWAWQQVQHHLHKNDTLYFIGDAIDRGPAGIGILFDALTDERVTMMMGNHELMMLDALESGDRPFNRDYDLWFYNGGRVTHENFRLLPKEDQNYLVNGLRSLPYYLVYTNKLGNKIVLTHSGYTVEEFGAEMTNTHDLVWDRTHYWGESDLYKSGITVVHGHTPKPYLMRDCSTDYIDTNGALVYDYGAKICIDGGVHFTGETVMLNLDTFETIRIRKED